MKYKKDKYEILNNGYTEGSYMEDWGYPTFQEIKDAVMWNHAAYNEEGDFDEKLPIIAEIKKCRSFDALQKFIKYSDIGITLRRKD